jgi:hypothetical protein
MAVGDGIERSGKKRGPRHGGGLARARMNRKARSAGSLHVALAKAEQSRRPAQRHCVRHQDQPELTIAFNKLHKTADL